MIHRFMGVVVLPLTLAFATLLALAQTTGPASTAAAPAGRADQTVTVTAPAAPITLPSPVYGIATREFDPLRGQYALADGRTLTVSGRPKRMKAQIEGLPAAELVAASPSVLVARNRQLSLTFRQADNGVVRDVLVTYVQPVEVNGRRITR